MCHHAVSIISCIIVLPTLLWNSHFTALLSELISHSKKNVIWEHTALRTFWFFTISTLFPVMQMWLLNKNRRMAFCRNKIRFLAFTFYNSFSERNSPKVFNWIWKLSIWKWRFYFEKGLCVKFTKSSQISIGNAASDPL